MKNMRNLASELNQLMEAAPFVAPEAGDGPEVAEVTPAEAGRVARDMFEQGIQPNGERWPDGLDLVLRADNFGGEVLDEKGDARNLVMTVAVVFYPNEGTPGGIGFEPHAVKRVLNYVGRDAEVLGEVGLAVMNAIEKRQDEAKLVIGEWLKEDDNVLYSLVSEDAPNWSISSAKVNSIELEAPDIDSETRIYLLCPVYVEAEIVLQTTLAIGMGEDVDLRMPFLRSDILEAKKMSKAAMKSAVNDIFKKYFANVQVNVFALSPIIREIEKLIADGADEKTVDSTMKALVQKHREN